MSEESNVSEEERTTLPIERGFPIERLNEIAEKEARAKQWYRPIYTMHKWWARRLGCVFRSIAIYTLVDDPEKVTVIEPRETSDLSDFTDEIDVQSLIEDVDPASPESLWQLYNKDVHIEDKRILDPFVGGGTSLVETSRLGIEAHGVDLNPVAWFVVKKQLDAGQTDSQNFREAYETIDERAGERVREYYRTQCPNDDHLADVMYFQWVKELDCVSCGRTVPLFNDFRAGKARYSDGEYDVYCPGCGDVFRVADWQNEVQCETCDHEFVPSEGYVSRGDYTCPDCGQQYGIVDAVQEQDGFDTRLFTIDYYCPTCDDKDRSKDDVKGHKAVEQFDLDLYQAATEEWEASTELDEYVPHSQIPLGIMTDSTAFDGSIGGGHNLLRHGYETWQDLYNPRQLFSLATTLQAIDEVEDQNLKEFLLLAFSDALRSNTFLTNYDKASAQINDFFKTNSFDAPQEPAENNAWGVAQGGRTFRGMIDMVERGIEYANAPIERYIDGDSVKKTKPFRTPIGNNASVSQDDARDLSYENEFDAVITDPPYYDNIIYSEISNLFYVWLRLVLREEYEFFEPESAPRAESIVANPAENKDVDTFERELKQAFGTIETALKPNGALVFTYHHSDSESWGELLTALCEVGFEVTATYPVTADLSKHPTKIGAGDSVSFDIIIVARPASKRTAISWNTLRRNIYRTAQRTRSELEEYRRLSNADIGVVEMGRCFHEYSKHHGEVRRAGEIMTAKEVVDRIYGIISPGNDIGEIDVFLDLLETGDPSYDDLNKLTRGTDATPERMQDMRLYRIDNGFTLGTWDDDTRIAYIQDRVANDEELTDLDRAQLLRYRWEHGKSITEYLKQWEITDDLRELCEGLADATGDETYKNILETRLDRF